MRTVIILGTGATIGSGYTKCEKRLPGDRNFFKNQAVKNLISQYPALEIMLRFFRKESGDDLDGVGLEEVWTFLEFCSKGVYKEIYDLKKEKEEWRNLIRHPDSERGDEHCGCKKFRKDQTIPAALDEIDLALLAGWDLRRLLNEIYGCISSPSENIYQRFLKKFNIPSDNTTTFISLNYDTVLEHALDQVNTPDHSSWFYAHVQTDVPRDPKGIQIQVLKPHGSLNWLFEGNEPSVSISTDYQLDPVQNRSFKTNIFEQAMIVLPTQLKQELNIESTQDKVTTDLFTKIWKSMADVLAEANRVFIIGYSFPSTDHHFRTLMRQVNIKRKCKEYKEVYCCTSAKMGEMEEQFLAEQTIKNARLLFPTLLSNFHDCKGGFNFFVQ
ncbi:MAG: hypothetical protein EPO39_14640 [Candidatus Manganitrophaceae bacterium]|nr:MAG: hypothetical protein EPO39_14640 [Candidatus Manganitrophaceae bacterium]